MTITKSTIAILVLTAAVIVLVVILTSKPRLTEEMIVNREKIKHSEALRLRDSAMWVERIAFRDSLITLSDLRYQELESRKQPIYNAIKTIRTTVPDYTKEQLRAAITNY